jgi:hypothetical protein
MFRLGQFMATPGAWDASKQLGRPPSSSSPATPRGTGRPDAFDKHPNDCAVVDGGRILAAYQTKLGVKLWIITEADRSQTTVLLPEEYWVEKD